MKRIVIVDDESYIVTMLAPKFRAAGFEIASASNGEEGFNLATETPPDLLITDFRMPVLSGYDMCVKLKHDERTANLPVVMLSGHGYQLTPEQLALTNIKAVLSKPFSAKDLVNKVSQIMGETKA